jgi:hypothetical protein
LGPAVILPINNSRTKFQPDEEIPVRPLLAVHHSSLDSKLSGICRQPWFFSRLPSPRGRHACSTWTYVNRKCPLGGERLFARHKANWHGLLNSSFRSAIQSHWEPQYPDSRLSLRSLFVPISIQTVLAVHFFLLLFFIHGPVRLHHQFTQCDCILGIEPRHSHA